jgi:hypothetical protein
MNFECKPRSSPALKEHEHYRYLGVPIGMVRDVDSLESLVDDLIFPIGSLAKVGRHKNFRSAMPNLRSMCR